MAAWVYKCNNKKEWHGRTYIGDWQEFFDDHEKGIGTWGSVSVIPQLRELLPDDTIFAYQTERNELVGLLRMVRLSGDRVKLKVVERLGVKVLRLRNANKRIAAIEAFKQGPKQTLRELSASEAKLLLKESRLARDRSKDKGI